MSLERNLAGILVVVATAVSAACSQLSFFIANAPTAIGSFKRTANLKFGTDPRQRLDVYVPTKKGANRPVVVFWYGGSWTGGDKASYRFVGAALAERGFLTVLPDYRLSPAVKFPEFVQDGAQAVAWVQKHAAEFGGDPTRIVLMGHSAGAHTAAFLALNDQYLRSAGAKPEWIRGLIGLSGPYALVPNTDSLNTIFAAPYTAADWQPVNFVTPHAPPTLLFHGLADGLVSPHHATDLRDALMRAGVPVQAELYEGRGHADTVAAIAWAARNRGPVLDHSAKFINSVTAVTAASVTAKPASTAAPSQIGLSH
jgi:acetyl esterase/lipase